MGLETVTTIDDLVTTNPVGATDPKSEGDDHIRNIKVAVKAALGDDGSQITIKRPTIITGGTVTTSKPVINGTQTWNDGSVTFTADKINVTNSASAAASLLLDRQVGGVSKFKVDKTGILTAVAALIAGDGTTTGGRFRSGTVTTPSSGNTPICAGSGAGLWFLSNASKGICAVGIASQGVGITIISSVVYGSYTFTSGAPGVNDAQVSWDSAGIRVVLSAASNMNGDSWTGFTWTP